MILRFLRLNCSAMCALSQLSVLCKHVTNKHTKHGATNGHHVVFGGAGEKTSRGGLVVRCNFLEPFFAYAVSLFIWVDFCTSWGYMLQVSDD